MWHFQRIICIWICCVSCMFGTTQLSSLVQAVPYEYFDDHEQSFYDLDTEQIQAKYDTRLLSQQMLLTEQQQQEHLANLKGFLNTAEGLDIAGSGNTNKLETRKQNNAGLTYVGTTTTKLKSNDGHTLVAGVAEAEAEADENERNDWLEETATKAAAAATTSAITETLDELHLPRAASCFTNGQKYTHGQKVPRLDSCEVCLCMDGEIFCWWEKCDKKSAKASTAYDDYSTPFEESSTTRMQLNAKTTYKTTLKPMRKPKTNEDYKYDDEDSAEIREMSQDYDGVKEERMRKEHVQEQHKIHHNKQMVKKKIYQQQEEEKHNKKIKEQNKRKQEEQQQQRHKQQQLHKANGHVEQQHHHVHNHNNNHDYGSSGSSSKILNFPENLPSVLYYDYKTEEHHQHQHQHREQHLKHQKQKQEQKLLSQQHEKELKHRQQQHHVNRHHEYGQDFNTYSSTAGAEGTARAESRAGDKTKRHDGIGEPSTIFKYFSNGNENIYNGDLQTDSDILPEPPTKKPKFPTSITDITASTAKTTGIPISRLHRLSTSIMPTTAVGAITKSTATTTSTTTTLSNTSPTASIPPLKKQIFSRWVNNKSSRGKVNKNNNNNDSDNRKNNNNNINESTEDIIDTDDQDDAFHRWLTSTETNNKNNFTLNDAISGRDDNGVLAAAGTSGGGLDASNSDYNVEDRNYENIDLDMETEISTAITKTKATVVPPTTLGTATTRINAFDMTERGGPVAVYDDNSYMYENSRKRKYEQNFSDNNSYNDNNNLNMSNSNGSINSNGNNNNNSPFSASPYQNYKRNNNNNNNNIDRPTSSSTSSSNGLSSTTSNEDNGVASVVNIDIMLTASSAESLQQQQQPQQTNIETTNQYRQLQDFEQAKRISKAQQQKFIQPAILISTNDVDNNNPLYSIINDNTNNNNNSSSNNNNNNINKTITNSFAGNGLNIEERTKQKNMGVNLSSSDSNNNKTNPNNSDSATNHSFTSSSDNFSFSHIPSMVSQTNASSAGAPAATTASPAVTPPTLSTTLSPERQCNVMGTLYKIGDILPQDTGNCLQCICIDGSTSDDTPRVTCSPHNCPPLVLPDLFDATGY